MPGKRKDLSGCKFGDWEVLDFHHADKGNSFWNCRCKCGVIKPVHSSALIHGRSTQCIRCGNGFQDLTNRKFHNWTVLHLKEKDKHGNYLWLCECSCGHQKTFNSITIKDGRSTRCHKCNLYKKFVGEIGSNFFTKIKYGASIRSLDFEITHEDIWNLFLKQNRRCALTGMELSFGIGELSGKNITASLDRIDNNKGYTLDNIQWIHKDVNIIKGYYDEKYFIDICCMIAKNKKGCKCG